MYTKKSQRTYATHKLTLKLSKKVPNLTNRLNKVNTLYVDMADPQLPSHQPAICAALRTECGDGPSKCPTAKIV